MPIVVWNYLILLFICVTILYSEKLEQIVMKNFQIQIEHVFFFVTNYIFCAAKAMISCYVN
jgi:hypothetical protein